MLTCERRFHFVIAIIATLSLTGALNALAVDEVGIYWDNELTDQHAITYTPFETVTGHVVIHESYAGGGILGWECAVDVTGPGIITSWQLEGQAINAASPPSFSVGLASPLPPAIDAVVATFEMLVTEIMPVEVALEPIYFASIPGEMAYIDGTYPEQLRAMTPVTGDPVVATVNAFTGSWCGTDWVHHIFFDMVPVGETRTTYFSVESCGGYRLIDVSLTCTDQFLSLPDISGLYVVQADSFATIAITFTPTEPIVLDCALDIGGEMFHIWGYAEEPVAVETPTPLVVQSQGQVNLEWPAPATVGDQYHVYRKDSQGREDRLTETPLPATSATIRFSDRPDYPDGTTLRYSYAVVRDGIEVTRSPEVEVTIKSLPLIRTELLANVPNPFNPQTKIRFRLAADEHVRVDIFDVKGRRIKTLVDEYRTAGENNVVWQGHDDAGRPVSSGAYYVRLETDGRIDQQKIMMLK